MDNVDILYREIRPSSEVSTIVQNHWTMRVNEIPEPGYPHHVIPDGCVSFVYPLRTGGRKQEVLLVGPRLQPLIVPLFEGVHYVGSRLLPGAAATVLHAPVIDFLNYVGPLCAKNLKLGEELTAAYSEAMLDNTFVEKAEDAFRIRHHEDYEIDSLVHACVQLIVARDGKRAVSDIADELGLSERQLQRRFKLAVGLSPKQFARIRRVRSSIAEGMENEAANLAAVAVVTGFFDQSHMNRDCNALIGTPPALMMEKIRQIAHVDVNP